MPPRGRAGSDRQGGRAGPGPLRDARGCAVSAADAWRTPLGEVGVDPELRDLALGAGSVLNDLAHAPEHAIEVQPPFLQRVLGMGFGFLPVAVGETTPDEVSSLLAALDPYADLFVVSTDLSHYLDLATARALDRRTATPS